MTFKRYVRQYHKDRRKTKTTARIQKNGSLHIPPQVCDAAGVEVGGRMDLWFDGDGQRIGLTKSHNGSGARVGKGKTGRAKYVCILGLITQEGIAHPRQNLPVSVQTVNGNPMIVVDLMAAMAPKEAEELTR